ncbi:MAG TPA: GNAT family N-acetyltransferase [Steroidobacteraceae bacterium]
MDRIEVLRSITELEQLAPAWAELVSMSGHALCEPAWCLNAARFVHGPDDQLHAIALWRDRQLVGFAPLILSRSSGSLRYEIAGSRVLCEPAEIPTRDIEAAASMAEAIMRLDRPVWLGRLAADSAFLSAFKARAHRSGILLSPGSSGSLYVALSECSASNYEPLSSRTRDIVRRAERALAKLGEVDVRFARPAPSEVAGMLTEAFEVELQSWKGRAGSAVLQRADLREFFFHYGQDCAAAGDLVIATLRLDGQVIAAHVANTARRSYRLLKIAYDERQAKYRPGLQLLRASLRWALEQKLETYEFMGVEERWIRDWTDRVHDHRSVLFYPFNARGIGAFARDAALRVGRRGIGVLRRAARGRAGES